MRAQLTCSIALCFGFSCKDFSNFAFSCGNLIVYEMAQLTSNKRKTTMDHASKAQALTALNSFRRAHPHVTASALSAILKTVRQSEPPELYSRKDIMLASKTVTEQATPYGPMLVPIKILNNKGETQEIPALNPFAFLDVAARQSGAFSDQLKQVAKETSPDSPLRLAVYSDEIVPGNALKGDNLRKTWAVYATFLNFGQIALQNEDAWFPLVTVRSSLVSATPASIGLIFKELLKLWFENPDADVVNSGILLFFPDGEYTRVFVKLDMILQDGSAHKFTYGVKGDSGTRYCFLCKNVVARDSAIAKRSGSQIVSDITCVRSMNFATDDEVRSAVNRLREAQTGMNKADFDKYQQVVGINFNEHGLLFCKELEKHLKPVSAFCHDWQHCFFVSGTFQTCVNLLLEASEIGLKTLYTMLGTYCQKA